MTFQPKTFLGPSVLLHLCALGAILLISMNAATLKTPKDKQFRVKMVQSVPRVQTESQASRTKITPPPPEKKELVKVTKPEPEKKTIVKKPQPEKKRELVKREPKPKKEFVKIPAKSGRKIMKMPDHIRLNQQKWLKEREQKKQVKKPVEKPVEDYKPVKREITVGRERLKTATTKTRTFDDVRRNLNRERQNIDKRLKRKLSQISAASSHSAQHDEYYENQIIPAIQSVWITPSAALVPKRALCTIGFRVSREGRVSNVRVLRGSGYSALDNSAAEAVRNARFPAFPPDYRENFFDVEVDFECEPEN
jgi:TonB family protein